MVAPFSLKIPSQMQFFDEVVTDIGVKVVQRQAIMESKSNASSKI